MNALYGIIRIMIGDKQISHGLIKLRQRWLPLLLVRGANDYSVLANDVWQPCAADHLPAKTPFSRHVLLLSDSFCSFRCRSFAADLVAESDLDEAVVLDLKLWNPFMQHGLDATAEASVEYVFFYERLAEHWRVAVWVWPRAQQQTLLSALPDQLTITHILPHSAWSVAQAACGRKVLLQGDISWPVGEPQKTVGQADASQEAVDQGYVCALLSAAGVPVAMSRARDASDVKRFWRSLGAQLDDVQELVQFGNIDACYPEHVVLTSVSSPPSYSLLNRARRKGVRDWADPVAWRKPLLAMLSVLMLWMLADVLVIQQRGAAVDAEFSATRHAATAVLDQRERVQAMQQRVLQLQSMQQQQGQIMQLLAALSAAVPKDIWLEIVQLQHNGLDFRGQGKNVARLPVLLESLPGVKKVILLNDIRPDARTGLEVVQIRLLLTEVDHASGAGADDE